MKVLKLVDAPVFPGAENLRAKSFTDSDSFGIVHFTLPPNGFIPQHNIPFDVCFLVLQGTGILTVNNSSHQVETDNIIACSSSVRRNWRNLSIDENLRVLSLKLK